MLEYYTLTLTALGPIHIGWGKNHEISKKDCLYIKRENKVYIFDSIKLFNGMKKLRLMREYENYLMDNSQRNFTFFIKEHNISPEQYKSWTAYTLPLDDITDTTTQSRKNGGGSDNIAAFVKDPYGCPYIPGSSLKGAMRTAILNMFSMKNKSASEEIVKKMRVEDANYNNNRDNNKKANRKTYLLNSAKELERKFFYTLNNEIKDKRNESVNDIFRGLRISDSEPLSVSDLVLCQKIDVFPDKSSISLPIKRECLKPGTKVKFSVEIDTEFFNYGHEDLLEAIDCSYKSYSQNYLSVFPKIQQLNADKHLLYLGGGSGYATKTSVYSLFANREKAVEMVQKIMVNITNPKLHKDDQIKYNVSPHTRKVTNFRRNRYDMGLCSVNIEKV